MHTETEEGFIKLFTRRADENTDGAPDDIPYIPEGSLNGTVQEEDDPCAPVIKSLRHLRMVQHLTFL